MTGKRNRRCWLSMGVGLMLALLTVAAPIGGVLAGRPIRDWFTIGHDPMPPLYDQVYPSIAYNPDLQEYLVVWHNVHPQYPNIQAQRVRANGTLAGTMFYIAAGGGVQRRYPDVVWNATQHEYLVVWEETPPSGGEPNIWAQRVDAEGGLTGSAFWLSTGPETASNYRPAVGWASTSDLYMVVWERRIKGDVSSDIEAQVLSETGAPVGVNFVIAEGAAFIHLEDPDIGYNRSRNEYLVVWTRLNKNVPVKDIWGRIVTRDGDLLGSDLVIGNHSMDEWHPSVTGRPTAPNFGGYYVAWELRHGASQGSIYGREVGWDGLLTEYDAIWDELAQDTDPCVVYQEEMERYFVAWSRVIDAAQDMRDIYGLPLVPGTPRARRDSFAHGESTAKWPAVASGPQGDVLIAWSDAPWVADRDVFGRLWGERTFVYLPIVLR